MKHISHLFFGFVALCAVLASCNREEDTLQQNKYISFQASVGKYQVKATDTAFEKGDEVGLVVGEPLNIYNEKLTWDGSALKPAQPISWGETAKNQKVQFAAYYPYQETPSPEDKADLEFTVRPDQSTHAGYTASDLMVALTEATPAAETVRLSFEHLLSKVVIKIENHLDVGISEVYMGDVYGKIWVDINDSPEPHGSKGTIKAGKVTVNGEEAWALIVVPAANLNPTLMIITTDQKQYTYTIDNPIEFRNGRRYGASVVLDEDAIFTDFTSDITDWVDDADLQFGQDPGPGPEPGDGIWYIGMNGQKKALTPTMYEDHTLHLGAFYGEKGQKVELYLDDVMYRLIQMKSTDYFILTTSSEGKIYEVPETGVYELYVDTTTDEVAIHSYEEGNPASTWTIIGDIEGKAWSEDISMYLVPLSFEGKNYPGYTAEILYTEGEKFKFRLMKSWDYEEYGYGERGSSTAPLEPDTVYPLTAGGGDIQLAQSGRYRIEFNWDLRQVEVKYLGELVQLEGDGTLDNPYTVADAIELTKNLSWTSNNEYESVGPFYVEGVVSKVTTPYGTQFGNANFTISTDGSLESPQFTAYQVYFLENQKWVATFPQVEVGDAVIVYAPLMNYQGKQPETVGKKGYVYSLNGITLISDLPEDDPIPTSEPTGSGTLEDPYNAVAVNAQINAGAIPEGTTVYVAGKVAEITEAFATKFGNASFYINDSGDPRAEGFLCFRVLYLGNRKWVDGDASLAVGDEVVVAGEVTLYKAADGSTLPETVANKGYLFSLNGEGAPEEEKTSWAIEEVLQEPDGTHVVIENAIVYAVSSKGFVVSEHPNSESSLMVYSGYMDDVLSPGDHVYIQGVKGTYNHVPQISVTAEEDYYNRWHDDNSEMEWLNYSAIKIDDFLPLEVKPCYLTGIMDYTWKDNTGYFSVKPAGAERSVSLYWPYCPTAEHYERLTRMNGLTVMACGFSLGYADDGPYSYMMYRNVQVVDAVGEVTIALLLNDEDYAFQEGQYFKVSGTVSEINDRDYGNFYIKDEDGNKLYINGTHDEYGNYPSKWSLNGRDFGRVVSVGRKVTVIGARYKYVNQVELQDCYVIN